MLTYEAAFDDQGLSEWPTFDAAICTLSGTPWSYHRFTLVEVTITASDGIASVSDTFEIAVAVDYSAGPARLSSVTSVKKSATALRRRPGAPEFREELRPPLLWHKAAVRLAVPLDCHDQLSIRCSPLP